MRLTVTPIGAMGRTTAAVAKAVADYLEGDRRDPGVALLAPGQATGPADGAAAYYADSPEGPGRWLGAGATYRGLVGVVDREAFIRVLGGRDPRTGARLVTAQGSSQRSHLAVGTAAAFDEHGEVLYTISDAASLLGVRARDVRELIDAGNRGGDYHPTDGGWIASIDHPVHGRMITDSEITRLQELAATPIDAHAVRHGGDPRDELTVAEAAAALRVAPSYVRRLCRRAHQPADERSGTPLVSRLEGSGRTQRYMIRRGDLAEFVARRKAPTARVGFDLTLTAEKSLAVVTMLAARDRQAELVRALRVANDTAIAHLDRVASVGRRTGEVVSSEGLLVASYFHGTSRALDPHPHHHNVVANAIVDDHGEVRTLDARALYRHAPAAAALATAAVRWELRDSGVDWWRRDDGVWELAGVDHDTIREFSQRHGEIDEVRKALEDRLGRSVSAEERNIAALQTRDPKSAVDPIGLREQWLSRADRVCFDVNDCFDRPTRVVVHERLPDDLARVLFADLVDGQVGLCAESNTFTRADVYRAIADWSLPGDVDDAARRKVIVPPAEIERLTAEFCATTLVAEVDGGGVIRRRDGSTIADGQSEPVFTTIELLEVQHDIAHIVAAGIDHGAGLATGEHLDAAFASDRRLSAEQRTLVEQWLTSGDRVQLAVGRAGTGKTTTMRAAAAGWDSAGYRVIGAAVKGEAARQLGDDAGIETETVAMLLARQRAGIRVLDARTVVIVDEASTIGDRDLHTLLHAAIETRATVRLIGDTAQHGSVPAGGTYAHLVDLHRDRTAELAGQRRLTDPGERRRADLVRSGAITDALDELVASGQLLLAESDADTYAAVLQRWATARAAGRAHPMVHQRNRERQMLNTLAQQLRASAGEIDTTQAVQRSDGRRLCVGDEVIARHGDRNIHPDHNRAGWMRNGTVGTIIAVRNGLEEPSPADQIDIATADGTIGVPRAVFDHQPGGIDLAYAVTSYAIQGSTRDASTSVLTATTARSELYVDITRGRRDNQLVGTRAVTETFGDEAHLPTNDVDLVDSLRSSLARGDVKTAAVQARDGCVIERQRHGRTLAGLDAAKRRSSAPDPLLDAAIARSERAIARLGVVQPDPALGRLVDRPTVPHLAARWDRLAGDISIHHARQGTNPRTAERGIASIVSTDTDIAAQLSDLCVDVAYRRLGDHLDRDDPVASVVALRPPWLTAHLEQRAQTGRINTIDVDQLAALIADVYTWRVEHHLIDNTPDDQPLGPACDNNIDRARQRALARRLNPPRTTGGSRSIT